VKRRPRSRQHHGVHFVSPNQGGPPPDISRAN
jgi:hypothetical protein